MLMSTFFATKVNAGNFIADSKYSRVKQEISLNYLNVIDTPPYRFVGYCGHAFAKSQYLPAHGNLKVTICPLFHLHYLKVVILVVPSTRILQ